MRAKSERLTIAAFCDQFSRYIAHHYHAHDPIGTDPEVKYTRAQIASLVIRESILGWSCAER